MAIAIDIASKIYRLCVICQRSVKNPFRYLSNKLTKHEVNLTSQLLLYLQSV